MRIIATTATIGLAAVVSMATPVLAASQIDLGRLTQSQRDFVLSGGSDRPTQDEFRNDDVRPQWRDKLILVILNERRAVEFDSVQGFETFVRENNITGVDHLENPGRELDSARRAPSGYSSMYFGTSSPSPDPEPTPEPVTPELTSSQQQQLENDIKLALENEISNISESDAQAAAEAAAEAASQAIAAGGDANAAVRSAINALNDLGITVSPKIRNQISDLVGDVMSSSTATAGSDVSINTSSGDTITVHRSNPIELGDSADNSSASSEVEIEFCFINGQPGVRVRSKVEAEGAVDGGFAVNGGIATVSGVTIDGGYAAGSDAVGLNEEDYAAFVEDGMDNQSDLIGMFLEDEDGDIPVVDLTEALCEVPGDSTDTQEVEDVEEEDEDEDEDTTVILGSLPVFGELGRVLGTPAFSPVA